MNIHDQPGKNDWAHLKEKLEQMDSLQKVKQIAKTEENRDETDRAKKLATIEDLKKVLQDIDSQLSPGQGAAQSQSAAATPGPLSTWQKMNVLLNPAVPPVPTR